MNTNAPTAFVASHETSAHMQALYSYINASTMDDANANSTVSNITTANGTFCVFPFLYQDTLQSECVSPSQGAGGK